MTESGKNAVSGEKLSAFIERIEALREQKAELGDDEKQVFAELKAEGYNPKRVRDILRRRAQKPHDLQEAEQELDMYLHALGMASEAPLFRAVGLMSVDVTVREQVIEAFKQLVPANGEIIAKVGGRPVRIWRDEEGTVSAEDYVDPATRAPTESRSGAPLRPEREPPPDVNEAGAGSLGTAAYEANEAITANPFPFGDKRRPVWDQAWRDASGSDGMGES